MKRIVHFVDGLNFGGVQEVVLVLSKYAEKNGWDVHIISLYSDYIDLVPYFPKQIKLHYLPFSKDKKGLTYYILYFRKLYRLLKKLNPNVIHVHNTSFSLLFFALGVTFSLKKIFIIRTLHISGFFLLRSNFAERIRFFIDKLATNLFNPVMVAVSPFVLESIVKLYPRQKSLCILNGVDTEIKFNPSIVNGSKKRLLFDKFDRKVVVYVARLDDGKNHKTLFDAWDIVNKTMSDVCLCLVGDGPLLNAFKEEVNIRNLSSSIIFVGAVFNVNEYLSISDVAVFPSLSEGLGISLLEKMSMGLPVVVSKIPVFTSMFKDNPPVLFYESLDCNDLADKIILLLKDKSLSQMLGTSGRQFVRDNFSVGRMCNQYLQLYDSSLN